MGGNVSDEITAAVGTADCNSIVTERVSEITLVNPAAHAKGFEAPHTS